MKIVLLVLLCALFSLPLSAQDAPKWREGYLQTNSVKLHYVSQGEGQVVLFLHGFPEFWYEWRRQIPEFAKTHRAIAIDMRGYNLSEKPPKVEDYSIPNLITDIRTVLGTFSKGKKAILVAHDWGGAVAWLYAAKHPETLEKLVIINAPHPTIFTRELLENPKQRAASAYMTFFRGETAEKVLSADNYLSLQKAVFEGGSKPNVFTEAEKAEYLKAWAQPGALTGGLNYYRAAQIGPPANANAKTLDSSLSQTPVLVNVPTLVLWGEKDTALLAGNLDGLDKYVPNLTIQRIPNGSHWVLHEEPETITRAIRAFLQRKEEPKP